MTSRTLTFDLLDALFCDRGDIVDGQLKQFAPRMCPAIGQLNGGVVTSIFDTIVASIAINLQNAIKALQYLDSMFTRTAFCRTMRCTPDCLPTVAKAIRIHCGTQDGPKPL